MRVVLIAKAMLLIVGTFEAQPNCNVYLWRADTAQYNACKLLTENQANYYQFSKAYHKLLDSVIAICPHFAYAYREKAAPYVKSGNFIEWKKNIDLAVKYDSVGYLPVRASLRYKFFADYIGAIQDIDLLEKLNKFDIGTTSNGTYHLTIVKALCYKKIGLSKKGIDIIEHLMQQSHYNIGLYDYFHLGVMYYETKDYQKSRMAFIKQLTQYEFAEVQYYLAQIYKINGNIEMYRQAKQSAKTLFKENKKMFDQYHYMFDQIFEQNIDKI